MKKTLFILFLLAISFTSFSQVFRVGTGFGFGYVGKRAGLNLNVVDVSYAPNPNIDGGIYYGLAANYRYRITGVNGSLDQRYGLQGRYYFKETIIKPYAGVQVGLRTGRIGELTIVGGQNGIRKGTKFELSPMVGAKIGPFNANIAYQQGLKLNFGVLFSLKSKTNR